MTTLSTAQWSLPAWAVLAVAALVVALVVLALVMGVAAGRARRRARTALTALEARVADLSTRLDDLSVSVPPATQPAAAPTEYVITSLGELSERAASGGEAVTLTAPAFADAVLRESVVHTASFLHGLRHALAPETRNRIRFEMRRELKRTRKERKVEMKEALREYRARQRSEVGADAPGHLADGAA